MSMFDDLFGGIFDFNGDGETTPDEMMIADEIFFSDDRNSAREFGVDDFDDDFDVFDNFD